MTLVMGNQRWAMLAVLLGTEFLIRSKQRANGVKNPMAQTVETL